MKRVTRKTVDDYLRKNRPGISTYERQGKKGVCRDDKGPAHSFRVIGKTWKDVLNYFKHN